MAAAVEFGSGPACPAARLRVDGRVPESEGHAGTGPAIEEDADVRGCLLWSLLDDFEWAGAVLLRRGPSQGRRQESSLRWEPAMGPIRSIPPSTDHDAPVT